MKTLDSAFSNKYRLGKVVINGVEFYYSNIRIPRNEVPDGFTKYEVRESDIGGDWATIERGVMVNFAATLLTDQPIELEEHTFRGRKDYYTEIETLGWLS